MAEFRMLRFIPGNQYEKYMDILRNGIAGFDFQTAKTQIPKHVWQDPYFLKYFENNEPGLFAAIFDDDPFGE